MVFCEFIDFKVENFGAIIFLSNFSIYPSFFLINTQLHLNHFQDEVQLMTLKTNN
jgi:hypothetical protein